MSKPVKSSDLPPAPPIDLQFAANVTFGSSADKSNNSFSHRISRDNRYNPIQKHKASCQFDDCRRIVPVAMRDIKCRCDKVFCSHHRLSFEHHCTYDWKAHDLERLQAATKIGPRPAIYYDERSNDHAY